jgi:hypothetical protein
MRSGAFAFLALISFTSSANIPIVAMFYRYRKELKARKRLQTKFLSAAGVHKPQKAACMSCLCSVTATMLLHFHNYQFDEVVARFQQKRPHLKYAHSSCIQVSLAIKEILCIA